MLKIFESFAGYGGASFGLIKANIEFEVVGYSEIDKGAIKCYEQNHKGKNYGDIKLINPSDLPDFDLFTGGFPCQDVSLAGNRDLSKGRTNLYLEILRIISIKKPKFLLLENVKGLDMMEVDGRKLSNKIVNDLHKLGYGVCWKILNSKDFGIPQNRERIWFVGKLGGWDFNEFQFPNKEELKIRLKDILEKDVDKKYYLTKHQLEFINYKAKQGRGDFLDERISEIPTTSQCLRTGSQKRYVVEATIINEGLLGENYKGKRILSGEGIYSTLVTHNNDFVSIIGGMQEHQTPREDGISPSLNASMGEGGGHKPIVNFIRVLTPKECFRLMGFLNDEIKLDGLSDSQKYKLAGNGWDINLVSKIFKKLKKQIELKGGQNENKI